MKFENLYIECENLEQCDEVFNESINDYDSNSEKEMTEQEIKDRAPHGATHTDCYSNIYKYYRNTWYRWTGHDWTMCHFTPNFIKPL